MPGEGSLLMLTCFLACVQASLALATPEALGTARPDVEEPALSAAVDDASEPPLPADRRAAPVNSNQVNDPPACADAVAVSEPLVRADTLTAPLSADYSQAWEESYRQWHISLSDNVWAVYRSICGC